MKKDVAYVAIQFILFALYFVEWALFQFVLPLWLNITAIVFIVFGLIIILLGILHLNENISIFPSPKRGGSLMSRGIYSYVRHPIYLGIIVAMISYGIFCVSPIKLLITGVMIILLYFKSSFEEKKLMESFAEYKDYRKVTGRFFPKRSNRAF